MDAYAWLSRGTFSQNSVSVLSFKVARNGQTNGEQCVWGMRNNRQITTLMIAGIVVELA